MFNKQKNKHGRDSFKTHIFKLSRQNKKAFVNKTAI